MLLDRMNILRHIIKVFLILLFVFIAIGLDCRMQITRYSIFSEKISGPVKIVLLADLHSCNYGKGEQRLVNKIDLFKPDIILLAGDIYDNRTSNKRTSDFLHNIGPRYRCFYVTGNHEVMSGVLDSIKKDIRSSSITILEGQTETICIGNDSICISGMPDLTELGNNINFERYIDHAATKCNFNNFSIFLSHRPEMIPTYLKAGFDLSCVGHYHGGLWRLPYIKEGLFATDHPEECKYTGGIYKKENQIVVVSRGLYRSILSIPRFFNRPELVEITIWPRSYE